MHCAELRRDLIRENQAIAEFTISKENPVNRLTIKMPVGRRHALCRSWAKYWAQFYAASRVTRKPLVEEKLKTYTGVEWLTRNNSGNLEKVAISRCKILQRSDPALRRK